MQSDLDSLGYVLEHGAVDSQCFLLPQRRNRIYATADLSNGQCASEYGKNMQKSMDAMSSDIIIPVDSILDASLPQQELTTERQQAKLQEALDATSMKRCHDKHLFIDGSTSMSRPSEHALGVLTCIRPSHGIYSEKLRRWVTVSEMWAAQGLWAINFGNPAAVDSLLSDQVKDAHDLVGNAFSGTVVQAKVLASIVHSFGWINIGHDSETTESKATCVVVSELDDCDQQTQTPSCATMTRSFSSVSSSMSSSKKHMPDEPDVVQPEPKRMRYVGKCPPRLECEKLPPEGLGLAQPDLPSSGCKQQVESLRAANADRKRSAPNQPEGEPKPKRKYETQGKTARDGKNGVISIFRKLQLLKVPGLSGDICSVCVCIYIYIYLLSIYK